MYEKYNPNINAITETTAELITTFLKDLNNLIEVRAGNIIILLIKSVPISLIPTTISTAVSIAIKYV